MLFIVYIDVSQFISRTYYTHSLTNKTRKDKTMKSLKTKIAGKALGKLISQMLKEGNVAYSKEKHLNLDDKTETKK